MDIIPKAAPSDFTGRFREIISDPLNLLIRRHPMAGLVADGLVTLHNGHRVALKGPGSYYGDFSTILCLNRGVHEPVEEFAFQQMIPHLPPAPVMLELGAYWAHYSMWLKRERPQATTTMVEPEAANLAAGQANFARHGYQGNFVQDFVSRDHFGVDRWMHSTGTDHLTILHADIQGHEVEMLQDAAQTLSAQRVSYAFVSTHGADLHDQVRSILSGHGYRIELSSDFDWQTTSYDGFVLAVAPSLPPVIHGPAPLGRTEIAHAAPAEVLARLTAMSGGQSPSTTS